MLIIKTPKRIWQGNSCHFPHVVTGPTLFVFFFFFFFSLFVIEATLFVWLSLKWSPMSLLAPFVPATWPNRWQIMTSCDVRVRIPGSIRYRPVIMWEGLHCVFLLLNSFYDILGIKFYFILRISYSIVLIYA